MWRGNIAKGQLKFPGGLRGVTTAGWSLAVTRRWPVAENWRVLKKLRELTPWASSLPVEGGGGSFPVLEKNIVILEQARRTQACFQRGLGMDAVSCSCCSQVRSGHAGADAPLSPAALRRLSVARHQGRDFVACLGRCFDLCLTVGLFFERQDLCPSQLVIQK